MQDVVTARRVVAAQSLPTPPDALRGRASARAVSCHAVPFRAASRSVASQDETRDARTQASKLTLETAIFCLCRYYYIFVITSIIPIDGGRQKGVGSADAHLIPSRNRFFLPTILYG